MAEQRYQAVMAVIAQGETVKDVAARWNVSRQTLHAWLAKHEAGGLEGLADGSHRPAWCPHQMPTPVEVAVGDASGASVLGAAPDRLRASPGQDRAGGVGVGGLPVPGPGRDDRGPGPARSCHPFATYDYFNYRWSLSTEEQFYLLWPFALLWGHRRNPRLFVTLAASLIAITLALNLYLGLSRSVKYDQHSYFGTDTNALPILVGSMLALVLANGWLSGNRDPRARPRRRAGCHPSAL